MKYAILALCCSTSISLTYAAQDHHSLPSTSAPAPRVSLGQQTSDQEADFLQTWTKTSGILEKIRNDKVLQRTLEALKYISQENLNFGTAWMKSLGIWDKCEQSNEILDILFSMNQCPQEKLAYVTEKIKFLRLVDKCHKGKDIANIIELLMKRPQDWGVDVINWMERSGTLDKCYSGKHIFRILSSLSYYSPKAMSAVTGWMERSETVHKCQNNKEMTTILASFRFYSSNELVLVIEWLEQSGILDKCRDNSELVKIMQEIASYKLEKLTFLTNWMQATGLTSKCQNALEFNSILSALKYTQLEKLTLATNWLKASGVLNKCQNHYEIISLLMLLKDYPQERLGFATDWIKRSGAWDKCRNAAIMVNLLEGLKTFKVCALYNTKEPLPLHENYLPLYIIGATLGDISEKCREALDGFIGNPVTRTKTLKSMASILGEESATTQEYLQFALGEDHSHEPDGFLAMHQEMMNKREQQVQQGARRQGPGVVLNLDQIAKPKEKTPIHLPLDVWTHLFDSFKKFNKEFIMARYENVDYNSLLELETNTNITNLLDPKDRVVKNKDISPHSLMLRDVLNQIKEIHQEDRIGGIRTFAGLLVDMVTCPTGKLNGISQRLSHMKYDTIIHKDTLKSEDSIQAIIEHFDSEFRCARELILAHMVKHLVKSHFADPHDVHYVRGVIGADIGLFFTGETPLIDMQGDKVSPILRQMSKQELLDTFYQYYTVEEIIKIFQKRLKDGIIQINESNVIRNISIKDIHEFLWDGPYEVDTEGYISEFVVRDESGQPIGLTSEAVKKLLLKMGFLTVLPQ